MSASPSTIALGDVYYPETTSSTFEVLNGGDADLTVTLTVENGAIGLTVAPASVTVPPGGIETTTLTFAPTAFGSVSTAILLTGNDTDTPTLSVPYTANVLEGQPLLTPPTLDLGDVTVNETAFGALQVGVPTGSVLVTGLMFNLAEFAAGPASGALPATVSPDAPLDIQVSVTPTAPGDLTGTLTVTTAGGTHPVGTVTARGVE